jgi:outer membrane protein OmpA-like peptidoglycan-associated protein
MSGQFTVTSLAIVLASSLSAQPAAAPSTRTPQPIYRVTIVSRTTKAINYGHRSATTNIDFRGTPLLPAARGSAVVENKGGTTVIDARFEHVAAPSQFGSVYLTYVLWAISPDGRAKSLGELVLNGSDKGKITVSTEMQAFAMIVTAEPYFSVPQPSDVVVMENSVRPDTVGKVEEVNATYELLPRKEYTYFPGSQVNTNKPVSMSEYEAITALYQAQNSIQIAESQGAAQYAADRLAKARQLCDQARGYPKSQSKAIVAMAREAAQAAEDARAIAARRTEQERLVNAEKQAADARKQIEAAEAAARAEVERAHQEADQARAEAAAAMARSGRTEIAPAPQVTASASQVTAPATRSEELPAPPATNPAIMAQIPPDSNNATRANRARLISMLSRAGLAAMDTPRGVVVTVPETTLESASAAQNEADRVASAIRGYPGIRIDVEGYTDIGGEISRQVTQARADAVRSRLIAAGLPASIVSARGLGDSRQVASNTSETGRTQNRRVEIVINGEPIGAHATWDRSYNLLSQKP